jgi:hypothetical protein
VPLTILLNPTKIPLILIQQSFPNSKTTTMSELALKLIREAKENRATRLDLGNCGLAE